MESKQKFSVIKRDNVDEQQRKFALLLTAAGISSRFSPSGEKKELFEVADRAIIAHTLQPFLEMAFFSPIVITCLQQQQKKIREAVKFLLNEYRQARIVYVDGGESRQSSVYNGLQRIEEFGCRWVLIHDAARPMVSHKLIRRVTSACEQFNAVAPIIETTDAIKEVGQSALTDNTITEISGHCPRTTIAAAQTPQAFLLSAIIAAHRKAAYDKFNYIDDSEIYQRYHGTVYGIAGERVNKKITFFEDICLLEKYLQDKKGIGEGLGSKNDKYNTPSFRVGHGYDLHRLQPGRDGIVLGGIRIEAPFVVISHSDGDVLLHALIDALLGACGKRDIGTWFPDTDPRWQNADSRLLLQQVVKMVYGEGWKIGNIDATIICQKPRLANYIESIITEVSGLLAVAPNLLAVKAKSNEKCDAIGREEAIAAHVNLLLIDR